MKKLIAVLLAMVMVFSMASVCVFAEEDTSGGIIDIEHGDTGNDDEIEETYYSLLNFFSDLLERINLLFEYIMVVFFSGNNPA